MNLRIFRDAYDCRIVMDKSRNENKGFCFILFENERDAERAYERRHEAEMDRRPLKLDFIGSKAKTRPKSRSPRRDRSRSRDRNFWLKNDRKMIENNKFPEISL